MKNLKKEILSYLYSHIEIEHIFLDCKDICNSEKLEILTFNQLKNLAFLYGF